MNGVFDKQTSGNDWTPSVRSMLHERQQEQPEPERTHPHRVIFQDLERQMARYEADHDEMVAEVARSYMMPRDNSVQNFLNSHRVLPQLLIQALPRLRERFGDTVFALRAILDEHGWQSLYVDALWAGDAAEAYAAIDRFEDDWWVANSHMAAGHLTFTYRLV
jgi:hypothetical protein